MSESQIEDSQLEDGELEDGEVEDDGQMAFLPFHALNEFMRPDFRMEVVRVALQNLDKLSEEQRADFDRLTRQFVKVPGFRNSTKAPVAARLRPTAAGFEKSPDLVALILYAWAAGHSELRQQMYDLLTAREWEVMPPDVDRTKLPGFFPIWPKDEDFDVLNVAFATQYPQVETNSDDVSLMACWISMRLPYQIEGEEDEEDGEGEE